MVPRRYAADPQLARWAHNFRTQPKYSFPIDLIRALNEIGFQWNVETVGQGLCQRG